MIHFLRKFRYLFGSATIIVQEGKRNKNIVRMKLEVSHWQYERENLTQQLRQCWRREAELLIAMQEADAKLKALVARKDCPDSCPAKNARS